MSVAVQSNSNLRIPSLEGLDVSKLRDLFVASDLSLLSFAVAPGDFDYSKPMGTEEEPSQVRIDLENGIIPEFLIETLELAPLESRASREFEGAALEFMRELYKKTPERISGSHHFLKYHDFDEQPVRILLSTKKSPFAAAVKYSNPPIVILAQGLFESEYDDLEPFITCPEELGLIGGHEISHRKITNRYGEHPASKADESICDAAPVEVIHHAGLDPAKARQLSQKFIDYEKRGKESSDDLDLEEDDDPKTREVVRDILQIIWDPHPTAVDRVLMTDTALAALAQHKGLEQKGDNPELRALYPKVKAACMQGEHVSWLREETGKVNNYQHLKPEKKVLALTSLLRAMDPIYNIRLADLLKELESLSGKLDTRQGKTAVNRFVDVLFERESDLKRSDLLSIYITASEMIAPASSPLPLGRLRLISEPMRQVVSASLRGDRVALLAAAKKFVENVNQEPLFSKKADRKFLRTVVWPGFQMPELTNDIINRSKIWNRDGEAKEVELGPGIPLISESPEAKEAGVTVSSLDDYDSGEVGFENIEYLNEVRETQETAWLPWILVFELAKYDENVLRAGYLLGLDETVELETAVGFHPGLAMEHYLSGPTVPKLIEGEFPRLTQRPAYRDFIDKKYLATISPSQLVPDEDGYILEISDDRYVDYCIAQTESFRRALRHYFIKGEADPEFLCRVDQSSNGLDHPREKSRLLFLDLLKDNIPLFIAANRSCFCRDEDQVIFVEELSKLLSEDLPGYKEAVKSIFHRGSDFADKKSVLYFEPLHEYHPFGEFLLNDPFSLFTSEEKVALLEDQFNSYWREGGCDPSYSGAIEKYEGKGYDIRKKIKKKIKIKNLEVFFRKHVEPFYSSLGAPLATSCRSWGELVEFLESHSRRATESGILSNGILEVPQHTLPVADRCVVFAPIEVEKEDGETKTKLGPFTYTNFSVYVATDRLLKKRRPNCEQILRYSKMLGKECLSAHGTFVSNATDILTAKADAWLAKKDVQEAVEEFVFLKRAGLTTPELEDKVQRHLAARIGEVQASDSLPVIEGLLSTHIWDFETKQSLIEQWAVNLRGLLPEGTSSAELNSLVCQNVDRACEGLHRRDWKTLLSKTASVFEAQDELCGILEEKLLSFTAHDEKGMRFGGVAAELFYYAARNDPPAREAALRFLRTPYSEKSCTEFLVGLKEAQLSSLLYEKERKSYGSGEFLPSDPENNMKLRYSARLFYDEFWHASIGERAILARDFRMEPEEVFSGGDPETIEDIVNTTFEPEGDEISLEQKLVAGYLKRLQEFRRPAMAAALLVSSREPKSSSRSRAHSIASIAESLGPLPITICQAAGSFPGVDKEYRDVFSRLKFKADEPLRWEFLRLINNSKEEIEREYNAYLRERPSSPALVTLGRKGRVLGSGSVYVTAEAHMTDGNTFALAMLRPYSRERTIQEARLFKEVIANEIPKSPFQETLLELTIDAERRMLDLEVVPEAALEQYEAAMKLYRGGSVRVGDRVIPFDSPEVVAAGKNFFMMEIVPGVHFSEMLAEPNIPKSEKRELCCAILAYEISNILHGVFDPDGHGGNRKWSNIIGCLDFKAMRLSSWSVEGFTQLVHLIGKLPRKMNRLEDLTEGLLREQSLLRERGVAIDPYVREAQKALVSLGEYSMHLKRGDLQSIVWAAFNSGMHPDLSRIVTDQLFDGMSFGGRPANFIFGGLATRLIGRGGQRGFLQSLIVRGLGFEGNLDIVINRPI